MSALLLDLPKAAVEVEAKPLLSRDVTILAPRFAAQLFDGLNECWWKGYDPVVYEAKRSDALQQLYYAQGRTRPGSIVTYAKSAMYSWHFFGLAVDVVSKGKLWGFSEDWIKGVAAILKAHGLDWGGDWKRQDLPHFQWGTLKPAPSDRARELYTKGGLLAVWETVGAIDQNLKKAA